MSYPNPHPNPYVVEWAGWLPIDPDEVPDHLWDLWYAAWEHDGIIDAIWHGEWHCCRELTTDGADGVLSWPAGGPAQQLALPPCTCTYALHYVLWCPTHLIDIPGVGQRGGAYTFRIDPWCPHHAPVQPGGWDAFPDRPYEVLLDEQERTGH